MAIKKTYVGPGGSTAWGSNWQWPGGSSTTTPPPAPSAPPPPPPSFDPYNDPTYVAGANAQGNIDTQAGAAHDWSYGNIAQATGYDAQGNLITDPGNPNFNPYSAAAVLKKHYDESQRGTANSAAAHNQLYAGSTVNAQNANTYGFGLSSDQLARGAAGQYHGADTTYQGVLSGGAMNLANLLGPAFQNFLAGMKGS